MKALIFAFSLATASSSYAADLKLGDAAPTFSAKNQNGQTFDLSTRKGHWTVLYFYPKA